MASGLDRARADLSFAPRRVTEVQPWTVRVVTVAAGRSTVVPLTWADDPPVADRGVVLARVVDLSLPDRAAVAVLNLGSGRYAASSRSQPGRWHRVEVVERSDRIGASCSCRVAHYRGAHRAVPCAHAAAAVSAALARQTSPTGDACPEWIAPSPAPVRSR